MYDEHIQVMLRTEKSEMGYCNKRLLHAVLGMADELGEMAEALMRVNVSPGSQLDCINFAEEIGDFMWYVSLAVHELKTDYKHLLSLSTLPRYKPVTILMIVNNLAVYVGRMVGMIKAQIYYNRELKVEDFMQHLADSLPVIDQLCMAIHIPMAEILRKNKEKLEARYPNGYSDEAANNRNRSAEREALEK